MSQFRSEDMALVQLFIQSEAAHDTLHALGAMGDDNEGCIQLKDLNADKSAFQRLFVSDVRRCDDMLRILRLLKETLAKEKKLSGDGPEDKELSLHELHDRLLDLEKEMKEHGNAYIQLKKQDNELEVSLSSRLRLAPVLHLLHTPASLICHYSRECHIFPPSASTLQLYPRTTPLPSFPFSCSLSCSPQRPSPPLQSLCIPRCCSSPDAYFHVIIPPDATSSNLNQHTTILSWRRMSTETDESLLQEHSVVMKMGEKWFANAYSSGVSMVAPSKEDGILAYIAAYLHMYMYSLVYLHTHKNMYSQIVYTCTCQYTYI